MMKMVITKRLWKKGRVVIQIFHKHFTAYEEVGLTVCHHGTVDVGKRGYVWSTEEMSGQNI